MGLRKSEFSNNLKNIDTKMDSRNNSHFCIKLTIEDLTRKRGMTTKHSKENILKSNRESLPLQES